MKTFLTILFVFMVFIVNTATATTDMDDIIMLSHWKWADDSDTCQTITVRWIHRDFDLDTQKRNVNLDSYYRVWAYRGKNQQLWGGNWPKIFKELKNNPNVKCIDSLPIRKPSQSTDSAIYKVNLHPWDFYDSTLDVWYIIVRYAYTDETKTDEICTSLMPFGWFPYVSLNGRKKPTAVIDIPVDNPSDDIPSILIGRYNTLGQRIEEPINLYFEVWQTITNKIIIKKIYR